MSTKAELEKNVQTTWAAVEKAKEALNASVGDAVKTADAALTTAYKANAEAWAAYSSAPPELPSG
jgi:hypothetical protein